MFSWLLMTEIISEAERRHKAKSLSNVRLLLTGKRVKKSRRFGRIAGSQGSTGPRPGKVLGRNR